MSKLPDTLHQETLAARYAIDSDPAHGAVIPPLYLSSNFSFEGFGGKREYDYTRSGNPTRDQLAGALAELEGGAGGVLTGVRNGIAYGAGKLLILDGADNEIFVMKPGANGFFDYRKTELNNEFGQGAFGLELLGVNSGFRFNGYFPDQGGKPAPGPSASRRSTRDRCLPTPRSAARGAEATRRARPPRSMRSAC